MVKLTNLSPFQSTIEMQEQTALIYQVFWKSQQENRVSLISKMVIFNGHFYKPNGERLRLWGVNITDWTRRSVQIPSKDESVFWARTLARYGVNCVRLTFLDFFAPRGIIAAGKNHTRQLDSVQLDKLDFWISELKKNGIYTDLNLLVGRSFKKGDGVRDYDKVGSNHRQSDNNSSGFT